MKHTIRTALSALLCLAAVAGVRADRVDPVAGEGVLATNARARLRLEKD